MATRVYGASDDLIELEGDIDGEVGHDAITVDDPGVLLAFSDGTLLSVKYGKGPLGIWAVVAAHVGELFEGIDICVDEDASPYSDVARFKDGLKWAYAATAWEKVQ